MIELTQQEHDNVGEKIMANHVFDALFNSSAQKTEGEEIMANHIFLQLFNPGKRIGE